MFYFLILVQLKYIDQPKVQENSIFYMKINPITSVRTWLYCPAYYTDCIVGNGLFVLSGNEDSCFPEKVKRVINMCLNVLEVISLATICTLVGTYDPASAKHVKT